VAAEKMPKNGDKLLKNMMKGQATTDTNGWRNAGEQNLATKYPVKGQTELCQGLLVI
jgi:hypothetical protein